MIPEDMDDLIETAVNNIQDTTEREATGTINGHEVRLVKEEYEVEQLGPTAWRVAVYVDDEIVPTEKETNMGPDGAEALFQELKSKHNVE